MSANWLKDLSLIPRANTVQTFKSYVDLSEESDGNLVSEYPVEAGEHKDKEVYDEIPKPHLMPSLLPGEVVIAKAENVLKFNTLSELNRGISGALVCTNFKLSFVTTKKFPSSLHQRNLLLSENDICLINVDAIYQVIGGKRRKLSQANPPSNAEIIEVHCKDFRIFTFSFKFCPAAQKSIISTILHHAFVPRINLLFAFDYQEPPSYAEENLCNSLVFTKASDWETELRRCNCPGWRVTHVNEKYLLCDSLPECFVVPSVLLDMNLSRAAPYFAGHRVPTWSWGLSCGVSLVRMAGVDSSISDNKQKELMVDAISRASPRQQVVKVIDVSELCPSPKEIQSSFVKLKDLCMPTTSEEYWGKDSNYLSDLDSTKWLSNVSSCLQVALEATSAIQRKETVVISEYDGRDVCCIISSLVQMILDPHYRTQIGFQTLIQKEWVALGHPFTERLRHISGSEAEESPVFLLFLDCVWQLIQQCPAVFDFSETYLTTLWDSCHISIFDTFLFTSPKSRQDVLLNKGGGSSSFCLRSVWNWSRQFSRNDVKLFYNPLYVLNKYRDIAVGRRSPSSGRPRSFTSVKDSRHSMRRPLMVGNVIKPVVWDEDEENLSAIDPFVKSLSFWHQCYLRWIPLAHIVGGGSPILYLNNLKLADEIRTLEKIINSLSTKTKHPRPPQRHRRAASDDYIISADSIDIQEGCNVVTSAFPFSSVSPWDWHSFQFVPSTSCLQISYTETDDHPDD